MRITTKLYHMQYDVHSGELTIQDTPFGGSQPVTLPVQLVEGFKAARTSYFALTGYISMLADKGGSPVSSVVQGNFPPRIAASATTH